LYSGQSVDVWVGVTPDWVVMATRSTASDPGAAVDHGAAHARGDIDLTELNARAAAAAVAAVNAAAAGQGDGSGGLKDVTTTDAG
jgi:hypothetical protein